MQESPPAQPDVKCGGCKDNTKRGEKREGQLEDERKRRVALLLLLFAPAHSVRSAPSPVGEFVASRMAPPGFLQTCAAIGGDVPRDECLAAYRWIGGGVLLSAIILLVVLAIVSGRAVCGKRAPRNPRVLLGAAWLGVVSWGVSGAALLTEGATWLSADASAVVNGVAESGGRQLAVLCLGVAIWLLAARMRPALPLDALSGVVIIGAPVVMLIVAGLAEAEDASSGINAALPPGSAAGCATCRIYDAASLLGAVLYAAGGAVALLRYCASQWANRASDAWLLGADLSGGAAHGLMLLLMLPGYWAAPIFQATACARGCSPFEGLAPGGGTALVIGLLGLASELPLGIGLAGLVAVTAAQLGVCTSGGTRLVVATSASRAGDEYVEGSKAWRARISREHSRERSAVLAHAAASAAPPERVVTSPLEVLEWGATLRAAESARGEGGSAGVAVGSGSGGAGVGVATATAGGIAAAVAAAEGTARSSAEAAATDAPPVAAPVVAAVKPAVPPPPLPQFAAPARPTAGPSFLPPGVSASDATRAWM